MKACSAVSASLPAFQLNQLIQSTHFSTLLQFCFTSTHKRRRSHDLLLLHFCIDFNFLDSIFSLIALVLLYVRDPHLSSHSCSMYSMETIFYFRLAKRVRFLSPSFSFDCLWRNGERMSGREKWRDKKEKGRPCNCHRANKSNFELLIRKRMKTPVAANDFTLWIFFSAVSFPFASFLLLVLRTHIYTSLFTYIFSLWIVIMFVCVCVTR